MASNAWHPGQFVADDRQAEQMAAYAMRGLGYHDARVTRVGADGGVDVRASGAIAQVKFRGGMTSRPDVQRLVGAAGRQRLQLLFFSASGYSSKAVEYAIEMDVALFTYTPTGRLTVHSPAAQRRTSEGGHPRLRASSPGTEHRAQRASAEALSNFSVAVGLLTVFALSALILAARGAAVGANGWDEAVMPAGVMVFGVLALVIRSRVRARGRRSSRGGRGGITRESASNARPTEWTSRH